MAAMDFPNSPAVNDVYTSGAHSWKWDGATWKMVGTDPWRPQYVGLVAPSSPTPGDFWFDSASGRTYTWYDGYWIEFGAAVSGIQGAAGQMLVDSSPPVVTTVGTLWLDSNTGRQYVWYDGFWLEVGSSPASIVPPYGNRNAVINGDFRVWQRGATPPVGATNAGYKFNADCWRAAFSGTAPTIAYNRYTSITGSIMPDGEEFKTALECNQSVAGSGGTYNVLVSPIEDVTTLAGKTVTLSFYVYRQTGSGAMTAVLSQYFGAGGTPSASTTTQTTFTPGGGVWERFSFTTTLPSMAGKTLGTAGDDSLQVSFSFAPNQVQHFWITGVQLEEGSVATKFERRPYADEFARCQRYYQHFQSAVASYAQFGQGSAWNTTSAAFWLPLAVPMRVVPAITTTGTLANYRIADVNAGVGAVSSFPSVDTAQSSDYCIVLLANCSATLTQFRPYYLQANNTTSAFIGLSAEL